MAFFLQNLSLVKDETYKRVVLAAFLFISFNHFTIALHPLFSLSPFLQIFLPLLLSQAIFNLYLARKPRLNLEGLVSQGKYLELSYEVLRYLHGSQFDKQFNREINAFF